MDKKETSRARQGFEDYYALGANRSIEKLHRHYIAITSDSPTRSIDTLRYWCQTFTWVQRVRDREIQIAQRTETKLVDEIADMRVRHAKAGQEVMDKGLERLQQLQDEDISPSEARAMVIEGAKLERAARGEDEGRGVDISILLAQAGDGKEVNLVGISQRIFQKSKEVGE